MTPSSQERREDPKKKVISSQSNSSLLMQIFKKHVEIAQQILVCFKKKLDSCDQTKP